MALGTGGRRLRPERARARAGGRGGDLGNDPYHGLAGIGIFFLGQNVLVGVCIAASVTVIAKREAGIGAGLVAGWLIGGLALVVTLIVITRAGNPAAV